MGYTKLDLITLAYEEIGLPEYVFDMQPEQLQTAVVKLDSMMAGWNAKGIRLGYSMSASPAEADPSVDSGIPDDAAETVYMKFGIRLASKLGRSVSADLKQNADEGYQTLLSQAARPRPMSWPRNTPAGAGNKGRRGTFLRRRPSRIEAGPDGNLTFGTGECDE